MDWWNVKESWGQHGEAGFRRSINVWKLISFIDNLGKVAGQDKIQTTATLSRGHKLLIPNLIVGCWPGLRWSCVPPWEWFIQMARIRLDIAPRGHKTTSSGFTCYRNCCMLLPLFFYRAHLLFCIFLLPRPEWGKTWKPPRANSSGNLVHIPACRFVPPREKVLIFIQTLVQTDKKQHSTYFCYQLRWPWCGLVGRRCHPPSPFALLFN